MLKHIYICTATVSGASHGATYDGGRLLLCHVVQVRVRWHVRQHVRGGDGHVVAGVRLLNSSDRAWGQW